MTLRLLMNKKLPLFVIVPFIFSLSACDGSGSSTSDPTEPQPTDIAPAPQVVTGVTIPELGIAQCGTIPETPGTPSSTVEQPASLNVGEVVTGTVGPSDAYDNAQYWQTQLTAGTFRLVLDTARIDNKNDNIGLELITSVANGDQVTHQVSAPIDTNEIDTRFREIRIVTVTGSGSVVVDFRLEVKAKLGTENYNLAMLPAIDSVPSPYFSDCPPVETLAPNTTQAFTLGTSDTAEADKWFYFQTTTGPYNLALVSSRVDALESTIAYEFRFLSGNGTKQGGGSDDEFTVNVEGVSATTNAEFTLTSANGDQWAGFFRIRNLTDSLNNEISMSNAAETASTEALARANNIRELNSANIAPDIIISIKD